MILKRGFADELWMRSSFIDLNGFVAKTLGMKGLYSSMGMYVTDDNYIVSAENETSTDYEIEQITKFKAFLDKQGINLLYVNQPTKYIDDSFLKKNLAKRHIPTAIRMFLCSASKKPEFLRLTFESAYRKME